MTRDEERQQAIDEEHLRLLSLFYYISAGLSAFFSLFGMLYLAMGAIVVASMPSLQATGNPPPAAMGWIFVGVGAVFTFLLLLAAALKFVAARAIRRRRFRVFCLVIAAFACIAVPYGTLLGIFSFIVLGRPSVKALFDAQHDRAGGV